MSVPDVHCTNCYTSSVQTNNHWTMDSAAVLNDQHLKVITLNESQE